ncbi:hypothetical protein [Nocardia asiatica]|uniref:hypothetical protein n=1 Tax=Nocardia asiatica TaxID=209252 RepID=UPI002455ED15|nr:hypothetical protein [Nocardia asiatica]
MSEQSVAESISGTVRSVCDELADALRVESFAGAVDEVLRPLYDDIARGSTAFRAAE